MPKVISHTPPWLCRPSPGAAFFTGKSAGKPAAQEPPADDYVGPQRTLARRGTEIFAVVDNQIRWADLSTLKENWHTGLQSKKKSAKAAPAEADAGQQWRVSAAL